MKFLAEYCKLSECMQYFLQRIHWPDISYKGEYAERIDNADELLESFLDNFNDENSQVSVIKCIRAFRIHEIKGPPPPSLTGDSKAKSGQLSSVMDTDSFQVNPDPDTNTDLDPGFNDQKLEKNYLFWSKIAFTYH
jgi:hypothetical protein